ncbi:hypothetical protein A2U01_0067321, partial [Trifolium medium]|nr:hypothetical protein [Trifolium medium]
VLRISHASLATTQCLISLNMLMSTPLNRAFNAFEFPRACSSSSFDQSSSAFSSSVDFPSLQ